MNTTTTARDTLRTSRLVLTPVTTVHAAALHALLDDWQVVRMLAVVPWPVTLEGVEAFAAEHDLGASDEDAFSILLGGAPIGVASVKRPGSGEPPRQMPRLGYWIGRPHWGRGYATEAVGRIVDHAFRTYPQDRIGAGVFIDNPASRRVLEKLGMQAVGRYPTFSRSRDEAVETDDMQATRGAWERARANR